MAQERGGVFVSGVETVAEDLRGVFVIGHCSKHVFVRNVHNMSRS